MDALGLCRSLGNETRCRCYILQLNPEVSVGRVGESSGTFDLEQQVSLFRTTQNLDPAFEVFLGFRKHSDSVGQQ